VRPMRTCSAFSTWAEALLAHDSIAVDGSRPQRFTRTPARIENTSMARATTRVTTTSLTEWRWGRGATERRTAGGIVASAGGGCVPVMSGAILV
jgi:hypothetical protein